MRAISLLLCEMLSVQSIDAAPAKGTANVLRRSGDASVCRRSEPSADGGGVERPSQDVARGRLTKRAALSDGESQVETRQKPPSRISRYPDSPSGRAFAADRSQHVLTKMCPTRRVQAVDLAARGGYAVVRGDVQALLTRAKKSARTRRAQVIEAGFIQARNLSSSDPFISNPALSSKLKV